MSNNIWHSEHGSYYVHGISVHRVAFVGCFYVECSSELNVT
jgi:hypothetical protein